MVSAVLRGHLFARNCRQHSTPQYRNVRCDSHSLDENAWYVDFVANGKHQLFANLWAINRVLVVQVPMLDLKLIRRDFGWAYHCVYCRIWVRKPRLLGG